MAKELSTLLLVRGTAELVQPAKIFKFIKTTTKILEFIGKCPEWINYNYNLEAHLQDLKRKLDCLKGKKTDVETELVSSEIQSNKKRKREVDHWLRNVRRKEGEVMNVENEVNSICNLPRFIFRAWLGSCISKELQQLNELQEQGNFPQGLLLDIPLDYNLFVPNEFVGEVMYEKVDQIWAHLINPKCTKIGVQGDEGMGKSAMMNHVYNRLCQYYDVYYVIVPQGFTVFSLQTAIANVLNITQLPPQEGTEQRRASWIFKVLNLKKGFVLIFDGLSRWFRLEDVGIPMQGCKGMNRRLF